MKAVAIISLSALVCFYAASYAEANCNAIALAKIIGKLCFNKSNQTLIDGFFGCYDQAPGKDQFVKCQTADFGGPINNVEIVDKTCKRLYKVPSYASCLKTEFQEAGLDMNSVVKQINDCQSEAMGIGQSLLPICRD